MKEQYKPSQEEISKAEDMMTSEQKLRSEKREQGEKYYQKYFDTLNALINANDEHSLVQIFSDEDIFEMGFHHPYSYSERIDWLVELPELELDFISEYLNVNTAELKNQLLELSKKAKIAIAKVHFFEQEEKVSEEGSEYSGFYGPTDFRNHIEWIEKEMADAGEEESEIIELRKKIPELRKKTALHYAESEFKKLEKMIRGHIIPVIIKRPNSEEAFELYQKYTGPRTTVENVKKLIEIAEKEGVDVEKMKSEMNKLENDLKKQLPKK